MANTQHFSYDGHAALSAGGEGTNLSPPAEIEIVSAVSMIPTVVTCDLDGRRTVVTAYVDHHGNRVHLPAETLSEVGGDGGRFEESLWDFFRGRSREAADPGPPREPPVSLSVPPHPVKEPD